MAGLRVMEMIDRPSLGGGQTALLVLAENLAREAFHVFVCSGGEGPLAEEVRRRGLAYIRVPMKKGFDFRSRNEIAAVLRQQRIDVLHTHGGVAGIHGRAAARLARTPAVVHTLHGIHYLHYRNPLLRRLYVWLERRCSRITDRLVLVCQSDFRRASKHRLAPERNMRVILNGLDILPTPGTDQLDRLRSQLGWTPGRPIVGTVARLHRQKGVIHLLRAGRRILEAIPESRIAIVGDGPQAGRLKREARRLGLEERCLFLGERRDAPSLMALFDIFVLPSLWEGLPFVLVEAAALGRPIVATAVDGVPEILEDGRTGLLVPPGDPEALAGAVIRLLRDREEAGRLAEKAKALVPPRFPMRRMVEQTQNLYLELSGR
ncbi:MAG: glycosyltransferase family 4 protein [Candidatus Aminicenantes bacterium]|nr:glycosyltransferase family 4 protein [Candidatus Aminicenantes bacterium]